ncbi:hypothetical protein SELMODRAFT_424996 [Selaginella moellendorffii]|uniref:Uncharacterized protein n=1 Tax=Selaginella moellendorffii TaxID=88036 RepID=D8SRP4_SELML|nr:hypothetical protein SELMODRAFT_424996 [Selaginella moellendorffii]
MTWTLIIQAFAKMRHTINVFWLMEQDELQPFAAILFQEEERCSSPMGTYTTASHPQARCLHGAVVLDQKKYVVGGRCEDKYLSDALQGFEFEKLDLDFTSILFLPELVFFTVANTIYQVARGTTVFAFVRIPSDERLRVYEFEAMMLVSPCNNDWRCSGWNAWSLGYLMVARTFTVERLTTSTPLIWKRRCGNVGVQGMLPQTMLLNMKSRKWTPVCVEPEGLSLVHAKIKDYACLIASGGDHGQGLCPSEGGKPVANVAGAIELLTGQAGLLQRNGVALTRGDLVYPGEELEFYEVLKPGNMDLHRMNLAACKHFLSRINKVMRGEGWLVPLMEFDAEPFVWMWNVSRDAAMNYLWRHGVPRYSMLRVHYVVNSDREHEIEKTAQFCINNETMDKQMLLNKVCKNARDFEVLNFINPATVPPIFLELDYSKTQDLEKCCVDVHNPEHEKRDGRADQFVRAGDCQERNAREADGGGRQERHVSSSV